jgi:DNA polymerase-3 subunit alpha
MPVTQFNMKYVEQTGLVKFDFLGLKTMTVIQKTVDLIKAERGEDIDILQIPLIDEPTYKLMADGHTVGVFQLESAGMRDTLRKMKPDRLEDIIALVSLYRPGPMDNIPSYIARKEAKEEPDYLHPLLKPLLEETYGIMIYQEQVMQCAQVLAGYTLGGADLLRRAMGKKIQSEMDQQRQLFVDGAKKHHDVPAAQAEMIFDQIAKFAGYGFNKSHAAAYALIAHWTAWLKANYPVEFMAASMTLDLGNTEKLSIFKQELDRMDIPLLRPCINNSLPVFKVEGDAVRYALGALKSVGEGAMDNLVNERTENGDYKDLNDVCARIDTKSMNKRQFENLASAGAFECIDENRAQIHGCAEILLKHAQSQAAERESGQVSLFAAEDGSSGSPLPPLATIPEWDPLDKLRKEFAAIGFYLSAHPLDGKVEQFKRLDITSHAEVPEKLQYSASASLSMAGILLKQQVKVSPKGNKYAFLQMSDPSGIYEGMMFSDALARAKEFLQPGEPYLLKVTAEEREEQIRYTIQDIQPLDKALEVKIREVQIRIADPAVISKVKDMLDVEGKGRAVVKLLVDLQDNKQAEIILPEKWSFSGAARNALLREEGISEILEN